jgi:hypothetical protein
MSATMINMDYRLVDILNANQLEVDDLIGIGDEVVKIISIKEIFSGFHATIENEFGEKEEIEIGDDERFELFIWD